MSSKRTSEEWLGPGSREEEERVLISNLLVPTRPRISHMGKYGDIARRRNTHRTSKFSPHHSSCGLEPARDMNGDRCATSTSCSNAQVASTLIPQSALLQQPLVYSTSVAYF